MYLSKQTFWCSSLDVRPFIIEKIFASRSIKEDTVLEIFNHLSRSRSRMSVLSDLELLS